MSPTLAGTLAVLLFALPLAGCLGNALLGPRLGRRFCNVLGPGVVLAGFVCAVVALVAVLGAHEGARSTTVTLWRWLDLGPGALRVNVDITIDFLNGQTHTIQQYFNVSADQTFTIAQAVPEPTTLALLAPATLLLLRRNRRV